MASTVAFDSMTVEDAIQWCQDHQIDISFRLSVKGNRGFAGWEMQEINSADTLVKVVQEMKRRREEVSELNDETIYNTPLMSLSFYGRNCEGRIQRLLEVIGVRTVGELLKWAADKPRGLEHITEYPNIGKKTLQVLIKTLRREGVEHVRKNVTKECDENGGYHSMRPVQTVDSSN